MQHSVQTYTCQLIWSPSQKMTFKTWFDHSRNQQKRLRGVRPQLCPWRAGRRWRRRRPPVRVGQERGEGASLRHRQSAQGQGHAGLPHLLRSGTIFSPVVRFHGIDLRCHNMLLFGCSNHATFDNFYFAHKSTCVAGKLGIFSRKFIVLQWYLSRLLQCLGHGYRYMLWGPALAIVGCSINHSAR